jgi:hypothetical protein
MESTPKKRKLNQDEIPRITYKWGFFAGTLLKYPTWGESFPKTMHMLTMIINGPNYFVYN